MPTRVYKCPNGHIMEVKEDWTKQLEICLVCKQSVKRIPQSFTFFMEKK
ncbi:hypothetical protein HYS94_01650 [Candidatus Daviesbacteria bacterium]|nr:hypothetical protein [Candidatus Daviesbacteria bacterium]